MPESLESLNQPNNCTLADHSPTHFICTVCNRTFPHHGHPRERCLRYCRGAEGAEQRAKMPGLLTRAKSLGKAVGRHIANGSQTVPDEVHKQRLEICYGCPQYQDKSCRICGCQMTLKAGMATEDCPAGKWPKWPVRKPGPLRVAFLTPSLGQGGAERWIVDLCRYLPAKDVDVRSVWLADTGQSWQPVVDELVSLDVAVFGGPNLMAGRPNAVSGITRITPQVESLRQAMQDIDVAVTWGLPGIGPMLQQAGFRGRVVVVAHCEGDPTAQMLRHSIEGVTHFAAVSDKAGREFPADIWPQVRVIWNGCDTGRVQPIRGRAAQRAEWGLSDDEVAIGYLGRLHNDKRPLTIVQAAVACGPQYRPVLIGEGLHQVGILSAARHTVGDRLIAPGPISPIGDALAALDVWMLASHSEGCTIAMLEAWTSGVPVVATIVGSLAEMQRQYGAMVTPIPTDPTDIDLIGAIHHALSPSGRSIADHARQVALEHLTAELSAQRWAEWLREICPVAV